MGYSKEKNYFLWKADCLICSFQRRAKKHNKKYDYITKRKNYADIIKEKLKSNCEYCNCKLNRSNMEVDHRIPISRDGDFGETNLAYVCKKCNQAKSELTDIEFNQLRQLVSTWKDKGDYLFHKLRAASLVFRKRR